MRIHFGGQLADGTNSRQVLTVYPKSYNDFKKTWELREHDTNILDPSVNQILRFWRDWRLPGRWPDGGRGSAVVKWTRRRAAAAYAPIPALTWISLHKSPNRAQILMYLIYLHAVPEKKLFCLRNHSLTYDSLTQFVSHSLTESLTDTIRCQ